MEKKQILLLVLAVVAGIIAVALTSSYVSHSIDQQTQQLKDEYDAQQKQMVAQLEQQNEQRMQALSQQVQQMKTEQEEATRRQIQQMQAQIAQQAQAVKTPPKKIKPSLALKTPTGKRAVTVQINSLDAVGGLLNPGDLVDVIAQLNVPGHAASGVPVGVSVPGTGASGQQPEKGTVTAMVFQGLEVLAVNTNLEETGAYYDEQQSAAAVKVTLAVDPEEAGLLSFADKNGKLELALRSPQDTDRQMVKASTWKTLADYVLQNQGADIDLPEYLKNKARTTAKPKEAVKPEIQIFRGGKEL